MRLTSAEPGAMRVALDYAARPRRAATSPRGAGCIPVGSPLSVSRLVFVALFCATMLLPTLGGRRVLTRHEVFAAEPAREMLHGGSASNWVIPHFAGIPRTVKPPTMGWLIAGSMALFHSESEWVVRLPSGLSAILMTVLIADLAARWLGPRVGLIAGMMQATFAYVVVQGRLAEADMPMAAAVCLAMYCFARGVVLPTNSESNIMPGAMGKRTRLPMGRVRDSLGGYRALVPPVPSPAEEPRTAGEGTGGTNDVDHHGRSAVADSTGQASPPLPYGRGSSKTSQPLSPLTDFAHGDVDHHDEGRITPSAAGSSLTSRDRKGAVASTVQLSLPRHLGCHWLPILFYLGAGLSFLLKGVGIVFVLASLAAFIVWSAAEGRDWRRCLRFLASPVGLILLALLLLAWPLAAWHADPEIFQTWWRELVGRASGDFGQRQPWYFYGGVVPAMLMPWLPFGIVAIVAGVRGRVFRGPVAQFLLCWFVPGLLILSASAWKHHHYVIPMMPAATLATAAGMELWLRNLKPQKAWLGALLWFAGCALAAALVWRLAKTGRNEIVVTVALLAVGGAVASYAAGRTWVVATVAAIFGTAWAVSFAVGFAILPAFEDYRWSAELAKRADREVPPGVPIYLLGLGEHNTAFYLRFPIGRVDTDVDRWTTSLVPGRFFALCPVSMLPTLTEPRLSDGSSCSPRVTVMDRSEKLHKTEHEGDRPLLVRIDIPKLGQPKASGF